MGKIIEAVFDGTVFRPAEPLELEPDTRVWITIEVAEAPDEKRSFLQTARSLALEGPPDSAENLDTYLYGKQDEHNG